MLISNIQINKIYYFLPFNIFTNIYIAFKFTQLNETVIIQII